MGTRFIGEITTECAAKKFATWCLDEIGIGWHPDTNFADYIHGSDGDRVFSASESCELNTQLEQCIDLMGDAFYECALDLLHARHSYARS